MFKDQERPNPKGEPRKMAGAREKTSEHAGTRRRRWGMSTGREDRAQRGAALQVEGACRPMCREVAQRGEINSDPSSFRGGGGKGIGLPQGDGRWTGANFLRTLRKVI